MMLSESQLCFHACDIKSYPMILKLLLQNEGAFLLCEEFTKSITGNVQGETE